MLTSLLLSIAFAAIPQKDIRIEDKKIDMTAEELLSMPTENRLQVAATRNDKKLAQQLWQMAFDVKKDMGTRWKALTLAAQLDRGVATDNLNKALESGEWFMRNAALVAYREILPAQTTGIALKLLKDKALVVRAAAIESLPDQLSVENRDKLWAELYQDYNYRKKQSLFVRSIILQKLAMQPRPQEKVLFAKALQEADAKLHEPAIVALEKISNLKFGDAKTKFEKKRALWIDWAKKNI